jgi:hypothetical protein
MLDITQGTALAATIAYRQRKGLSRPGSSGDDLSPVAWTCFEASSRLLLGNTVAVALL